MPPTKAELMPPTQAELMPLTQAELMPPTKADHRIPPGHQQVPLQTKAQKTMG